ARGHARSLRAAHLQAVASRLHEEQDDQAQQGSVRDPGRSDGAPGEAAHLLAPAWIAGDIRPILSIGSFRTSNSEEDECPWRKQAWKKPRPWPPEKPPVTA